MNCQSLRMDHFDPDQLLCATIEGAEILQRVLPGGELRVRLEKLHIPGAVLNRGFYGMRLVADGTMPAGAITASRPFFAGVPTPLRREPEGHIEALIPPL